MMNEVPSNELQVANETMAAGKLKVGQRLLPALVDEIARFEPQRILYSVTKTNDPADGFDDIAAAKFAKAVDRCAWLIEETLGRGVDFPTLVYIGPQDLVYCILILACAKTGYKTLLTSSRNTLEAHLKLLEATDCRVFMHPPDFPLPIVKQVLAARPMRVFEIPPLQHWLDDTAAPTPHYPYTKTWEEASMEPMVALHTSGSTGLPKPVITPHATYAHLDASGLLPSMGQPDVHPHYARGKRVYLTFPMFHGAGMMLGLHCTLYCGYTAVLGPFPPSVETVNKVLVHGNIQQLCIAPATLVEMSQEPRYLDSMAKLEQITTGGGPLPRSVGHLVSFKTKLLNAVGITESGLHPSHLCDREDWQYHHFNPVLGHEFRHISDGLYEQVIVRDPKLEPFQGIFATFPDLQEWSTKDMYKKHPTKEDLWLYVGRIDDIIVFSNGLKLNPVDAEQIVTSHPGVKGVLIAGFGRPQSSMLVEAASPPAGDEEQEKLLSEIWPLVQTANKSCPSHAAVQRDMIIFTTAEKPMLRAGKGTVQRKVTLDAYEAEIAALYLGREQEDAATSNRLTNGHTTTDHHVESDSDTPEQTVRRVIAESTTADISDLAPDASLFDRAFDSLAISTTVRRLNALLRKTQRPNPTEFMQAKSVYASPSIAGITALFAALLDPYSTTTTTTAPESLANHHRNHDHDSIMTSREAKMRSLFDKYAPRPVRREVVLLTGSTGHIGSHILSSLLSATSRISKIYVLIRAGTGTDPHQRQAGIQAKHGLPPLPAPARGEASVEVEFIEVDYARGIFSLVGREMMGRLRREVTLVVHSAWEVNFNLPIESFEVHVRAVRELVDFCAASRAETSGRIATTGGARFFFVSSVGAVMGRSGVVEERIYEGWNSPARGGYAESKFVAEMVLERAAREMGLEVVVCRTGQAAGAALRTEGGGGGGAMWPKRDWLPSLVASSKYLGKMPDSLGAVEVVDWVPVDVLGRAIVEMALGSGEEGSGKVGTFGGGDDGGARVVHAINPQTTTWGQLLPAFRRGLTRGGGKEEVQVVSLGEWVAALQESAQTTNEKDVAANPAVNLLDYFEGLVERDGSPIAWETGVAAGLSPALAGAGAVDEELVELWVRQWAF